MNRRNFIRNVSAISTLTVLKPNIVFASNNNTAVRIGLVGCGSRARGILGSMAANTNIQITAMADIFEDKLAEWLNYANELNSKNGFAAVDKRNCYTGYDSYLRLLDNRDIDAVIIASPAYTHPGILEATVAAGKHVYCEKPTAIDAEGCKQEIGRASCRERV